MTSAPSHAGIIRDGIWNNNAGLVQLLGLCPLLAVSGTVVNALGLGLATTLVLLVTNSTVSATRAVLRPEIRIPVFVLIIASSVTAVELVMNAFFHDLYRVLGIFIPLIVTNCTIIGRAEAFASRQDLGRSALDGLATGLGFAAVLVTLGAMREVLGQGTLFANMDLLFGQAGNSMEITLIPHYPGFLLAVLPPGAFLGLGLLVALKNHVENRRERRAPRPVTAPAAGRSPA